MNVLTVSNSPFNHTSCSKINAFLLQNLKNDGFNVSSAVWHHQSNFYMPEEDGNYYFEPVCQIVPLDSPDIPKEILLYEHMKKFSPNIVISIGDYHEISFISEIKKMYPNLFKWVAILAIASTPIDDKFKESLEYLDYAFVTSKQGLESFKLISRVQCEYLPFYPTLEINQDINRTLEITDKFRIIACSKNSQQSNFAALIQSIGRFLADYSDATAYVHANVNDDGEYDLEQLMSRFDPEGLINFPQEFTTFYDGISHADLMEKFASADLFVDCSMTAAVGLSAFEAMSVGCVPILTDIGAFHDLIEKEGFSLKGIEFLGQKEGVLTIVSQHEVYKEIKGAYAMWKKDPEKFLYLKKKCAETIKGLKQNNFVNNIKVVIKNLQNNNYSTLAVDILT